jgi:predicted MFS family arabinose efflux permease
VSATEAPVEAGVAAAQATLGGRLLVTLCLVTSLSVINALTLSPFLAAIAGDLDTSVALLGQAVTGAALLGATVGLGIGPAADAFGFRPLLVAGIIAMIVSVLGTALAPSLIVLIVAQLVSGVSAASMSPIALAIAGTRFSGDARRQAISRIFAASSAAGVVGFPILTTIGDLTSWRWSFVALGTAALATLALVLVTLPRDDARDRAAFSPRAVLDAYRPILRYRPVALMYTGQFLRGVCWVGLLTYVGAFFIEQLGLSLRLAGFLWVCIGPGFLLGSLLVNGRLRRYEPKTTFALTASLMGLAIGVLLVLQLPLAASCALLFLAAVAGGIAEVTAVTVLSNESPGQQGATMSLNSSITRLGSAGGALLGGALLAGGGYALVGLGLPLVAGAAALVGLRSRRSAGTWEPEALLARE